MKTKPLARVSQKRGKELRIYRKRVKEWLKLNPHCKACEMLRWFRTGPSRWNIHRATECHHVRGRNGDLLLEERWWLPVCRQCHDWITTHGGQARKMGLIVDVDYRGSV